MNIFKRIFRLFWAETNNAIEKLEEPIKMTEQGIRDLKKDLNKSIEALASVKAMSIKAGKEKEQYANKAKDYERKAMLLLQKGQNGQMPAADADRLAKEALTRKAENAKNAARAAAEHQKLQTNVNNMQGKVQKLRSNIGSWENELKTLKSRVKVSEASKKLNKQLSDVDSSSTIAMLERMREKVDQEEALADSYEQLALEATSVDDEIDSAIGQLEAASSADDDLLLLKQKMGMGDKTADETTDAPDA